MAETQSPRVLRFGPFEADLGNRQLLKDGVPVGLRGQAFDVLVLLLEHPGQLVTREQLRARLWPSGTVVEFDHSIHTAVTKLREALGEGAENPRFIATVRRHGYRFIAPVSIVVPPPLELVATSPASSESGSDAAQQHAVLADQPQGFTDAHTNVNSAAGSSSPNPFAPPASARLKWPLGKWFTSFIAGMLVVVLTFVIADKVRTSKRSPAVKPVVSDAREARTHAVADASNTATFNPPPHSIAVLPFVDMSETKDQEYFSDGLAEELIDMLAKTPGLHVIARTSSFSFRGKADDVPTIAAKLKVATVLEGSVRKSGKRLRVSTQLVRAADGEHLWSETYDRELKDIFKVQDEIAESVVTALKLKLSPGQESTPSRPSSTDAYFQYLLGQQYVTRGGLDGYKRAVSAYRSAVALDPHYAAAYAGLAVAAAFLADATGDNAGLDRAFAAAERAIALSPHEALGYGTRGFLRSTWAWDWAGAQSDFAKALELNPNDPSVLRRYSVLLWQVGRRVEAITVGRKLVELDPFSAPAWDVLALAMMVDGDYAAARDALRHALAIDPARVFNLHRAAILELLEHKPREALATSQKLRTDDGASRAFRVLDIAMAEYSLGHAKESQQALDEAIADFAKAAPYGIAVAYAWRGKPDKAFDWLESAYQWRDGALASIQGDPVIASLRGDPRYDAILRKINLSP
jgi:TolB-like protein/DNA-binding winged helix-turn-helix (wHTH) protein/Flp pilus assembly protein TadD